MEVHEAMAQIGAIRQQMARSELFRGFRSLTVAAVGVLAVAAAIVQPLWVPLPANDPDRYLRLWIGAALLAVFVVAWSVLRRVRASGSSLEREAAWLLAEQFLPCVGVGALMTFAMRVAAPETLWLLPGLWSMVFGLGVFAAHRQLPRPLFWVGVYFVASGAMALGWARAAHAFSPWAMGLSFGGGLLLGATILRRTLERRHDR